MAEDETATVKPPTDVESICKHADQLFTDNKWREALDYLQQFSDTEDSELLWRLIRMNYRIGKKSSNRIEAKKFAEIATKLSEMAMALHENDFQCIKVNGKCAYGWIDDTQDFLRMTTADGAKPDMKDEGRGLHPLWTGIILSWSSEVLGGPKMQIEKSFQVRDYWQRAAELKPDDAAVNHLLGRWCFTIASIPWYAASLLATPPTSSYEEALSYFEAAEKVEPGFYGMNWLYLGKTHLQLGHKEEARKWLQKIAECQATRPDDEEAQAEARTLLKKLDVALK